MLDGLRRWWTERAARACLGPVVAGDRAAPLALRGAVLALTLGGAVALERLTGRLPHRTPVALTGLALVALGLALHFAARRALGPSWSATVGVRAGQRVVAEGPYGAVRHPIYLAVALAAAGSVLAHPSAAVACLAGGLVLGAVVKARREERVLRAALGEEWARYARRVPALFARRRPE